MRKYIPIIIVTSTLVAYWAWEQRVSPPAPAESAQELFGPPAPAGGQAPEPQTVVTQGSISPGTSFFVEMQKAGISPVDIDEIVRSTRRIFNFRKIKPGQTYALFKGSEGELDSLHFAIDNENLLRVTAQNDAYAARIDTIPYRIEHYAAAGVIESSIFNTLQDKGADPELATYLALIFQWDIDFFKDIWRGDTFSILYERKVYEDGESETGRVLAARVTTQGREHYAFAYRTKDGVRGYYDAHAKSLQKSLLRAPLRYTRISSSFSRRRLHPVTHRWKAHLGVDYAAPRGTPVHATGSGSVVAATRNSGNGNYIKIRHNSRYTTYYLHLSKFARGIRRGAHVQQGQTIGYVGSTGLATAPHLDYRIKVAGRFVNPRTIRLPSKRPVPSDEVALFNVTKDAFLLALLDAQPEGHTVLVEEPRPPLQKRLSVLF